MVLRDATRTAVLDVEFFAIKAEARDT